MKGYGHSSMSDYHEMYDNWQDGFGYDPAYVGDEKPDEENNKPVNPDDWANTNDDFDGGF